MIIGIPRTFAVTGRSYESAVQVLYSIDRQDSLLGEFYIDHVQNQVFNIKERII